jgi:nitroreductase
VETFLAIASRRDERQYAPGPLRDDVSERILDAGRLSGSARNAQPWTFVIPDSRERVEAVANAVYAPQNVLSAALVVGIVVSGKGPVSFDAGRAAQSMLLAAWNEGVASCPNGIADRAAALLALDCGEDDTPVIVLSFGRPARDRKPDGRSPGEWSARANRRPLDDVVRRVT